MRSLGSGVAPTLCAVVALLLCGDAGARTGVIAPLNPLGIEDKEGVRVQRWITAAVSGVPKHRWLSHSRLARVLRQPRYRDCLAEPSCLGAAGRKVGAELVVAGDVGSLSGAYMVYLRLVSQSGELVRSVNGVLDPKKPGLRNAARSLAYRLLMPSRFNGQIDVKVDVSNAWIYLDGRRMARSPEGKLRGLTVGTHALRVTHEAYRDYVRFVRVEFGETKQVDVTLSAFPVGTGEMKLVDHKEGQPLTHDELPWYRRWYAVAGFGVVILAAATTTVALLANRSISRDSEIVVPP